MPDASGRATLDVAQLCSCTQFSSRASSFRVKFKLNENVSVLIGEWENTQKQRDNVTRGDGWIEFQLYYIIWLYYICCEFKLTWWLFCFRLPRIEYWMPIIHPKFKNNIKSCHFHWITQNTIRFNTMKSLQFFRAFTILCATIIIDHLPPLQHIYIHRHTMKSWWRATGTT